MNHGGVRGRQPSPMYSDTLSRNDRNEFYSGSLSRTTRYSTVHVRVRCLLPILYTSYTHLNLPGSKPSRLSCLLVVYRFCLGLGYDHKRSFTRRVKCSARDSPPPHWNAFCVCQRHQGGTSATAAGERTASLSGLRACVSAKRVCRWA